MITSLVSGVERFNLTSKTYGTPSGKMYVELLIDCSNPVGTLIELNLEEDTTEKEGAGIYLLPAKQNTQEWSDREFFVGLSEIQLNFLDTYGVLTEAILSPQLQETRTRAILWLLTDAGWKKEASGIINIRTISITDDRASRDRDGILLLNRDKIVTVNFSPGTEKLALTPVQINGSWNNALVGSFSFSQKYLTTDVITAFLKIINPDITVNFWNNWNWYYFDQQSTPYTFQQSYVLISTIFRRYIGTFEFSFENYLQTLKNLLLNIGMFLVFKSEDEVDIYPLLDRPIESTIDDNDILVSVEEINQERKVKYIETTATIYPTGEPWGTAGTKTGLQDDELIIPLNVAGFYRTPDHPTNDDGIYFLESDSIAKQFWSLWIMAYYANYYLNPMTCRRDKITVRGLYSCNILIEHNGLFYLPLKSTKRYMENETDFIAIPFKPAELFSLDGFILISSDEYVLIPMEDTLT